MSLSDFFHIVQDGGPDAIFLLLVFSGMWLSGRIFAKSVVDYRDEQIQYREQIIERQTATIQRQQELFDQALKTIRDDLLPLLKSRTTSTVP